jgi:hypothetical protein
MPLAVRHMSTRSPAEASRARRRTRGKCPVAAAHGWFRRRRRADHAADAVGVEFVALRQTPRSLSF